MDDNIDMGGKSCLGIVSEIVPFASIWKDLTDGPPSLDVLLNLPADFPGIACRDFQYRDEFVLAEFLIKNY